MSSTRMRGSIEELRENIERAVRDAFPRPKAGPDEPCPDRWAYPEATYADHVYVCEHVDGDTNYWRFDYTVDDDGEVTLGKKRQVELSVTVTDADGEAEEPGPDDTTVATRIAPAMDRINIATRLIGAAPEVKAESLEGLRTSVAELLDTLAGKGMDMRAALGLSDPDQDPTDEKGYMPEGDDAELIEGKGGVPGDGDDLYDGPHDDEDDDEADPLGGYEVKNDGRVRLDPDAVAAEMAALNA